jgi:hypothetical protein
MRAGNTSEAAERPARFELASRGWRPRVVPLDHGRLGCVRRAAGKPPSVESHHPSEPSTWPSLGDGPSEVARPPAVARFTSSIPPTGGGVIRRCCQPCLASRYRRTTRLLGPGRFVVRSPGRARADFPRPSCAGRDAMATRLTLPNGSTESRTPISRLRTARPGPLADGAEVDLRCAGWRESGTLESNQGGTGISDQRAAIAHVPAMSCAP